MTIRDKMIHKRLKKIPWRIRKVLHLPLYRVDILKHAKKYRQSGLCYAINESLDNFDLQRHYTRFSLFPLFSNENALKFGAEKADSYLWWWPKGEWDTGREVFLDWLIEQYKDDNTNLCKYDY